MYRGAPLSRMYYGNERAPLIARVAELPALRANKEKDRNADRMPGKGGF
jgi:hypothetical protein